MNRSLILTVAALFLLTACSSPAPTQGTLPDQPSLPAEQPSTTDQPSLPAEQPKTDIPTPGEPDRTAFADLPSDTRTVLEGAEEKAGAGIRYSFYETNNAQASTGLVSEATVLQKGSTIWIGVSDRQLRANDYKKVDYVSHVIIDVEKKTATGYCDVVKLCDDAPESRNVKYEDYIYPTPLGWLEGLTNPVKLGQETLEGRSTIRLSADYDGDPITIWVDRYSGVPVQVVDGTTTYEYRNLALGVKDSELA